MGKKIISPLDFGTISEHQIKLIGKFLINDDNMGVWNSALFEIHQRLIDLGLQV